MQYAPSPSFLNAKFKLWRKFSGKLLNSTKNRTKDSHWTFKLHSFFSHSISEIQGVFLQNRSKGFWLQTISVPTCLASQIRRMCLRRMCKQLWGEWMRMATKVCHFLTFSQRCSRISSMEIWELSRRQTSWLKKRRRVEREVKRQPEEI